MRKVLGSISRSVCTALAEILLLASPMLKAQDKLTLPTDPTALVQRAIELNSVSGPDAEPWRLKATLHTFTPATMMSGEENKDARYEELWAGEKRFKRTYSDEDRSQTIYGTPEGDFVVGGLHFMLGEVRQLHELFQPAIYLREYAEGHTPKFETAEVGASETACVRTTSDGSKNSITEPVVYRFCFDSSLRLVRFSIDGNNGFLVLFRRPISFQAREVPTEVELRRHGIVRMVANLESLEPVETANDADFQPPANAVPDESEAPHAPMPSRFNVSAGVASQMLLEHVSPIYPPEAKTAGISGTVVLQGTIDKDGLVRDVVTVSGPPELREAAIDAVRAWRYRPYLLNGSPVEVQTTINVIFTLSK